MLLYCGQDITPTLYCQLLNHVMENYCHPQQHGALHVFYDQQRHAHRLVLIYAVLPWQIVQQFDQRPI